MPAGVWKKRRRLKPCRAASSDPSRWVRASSNFCRGDCAAGMNSSDDTGRVGIGSAGIDSAETSCSRSRGESQLIGVLLCSGSVGAIIRPAAATAKTAAAAWRDGAPKSYCWPEPPAPSSWHVQRTQRHRGFDPAGTIRGRLR